MLKVNLSFAKVVATPTISSWSQAYNAGNFFVVLSLTDPTTEDESLLTTLGKQIIDNLETEFFGLETKNLKTIKQALLASLNGIPENTELSLALAYIKDNVLYVLIYGAGSVVLKRDSKIGNILQSKEKTDDILSASGYIKQGDVLVIQTKQFTNLIHKDELYSALELTLPSDIAETLSPHVHNSDIGGASAIIISITGVPASLNDFPQANTSEDTEKEDDEIKYSNLTPNPATSPNKPNKLMLNSFLNRISSFINTLKIKGNRKKLILSVLALIIIFLLSLLVIMNIQKRKTEERKINFKQIYAEANEKYQEAIGIKSLNPTLSSEILKNADTIIDENIKLFPKNSEESLKLIALQKDIRGLLKDPVEGKEIQAEEVDNNESPILAALLENKNTLAATEDKSFIYFLNQRNIESIDKNTENKKELVKNEDDWKNGISIGTYLGNLYVLDKGSGVLKYVVAQDGYGKTDYFTNLKPNLSKAVSLAIDGSIWILSSDSRITKYTRGEEEPFTLKGISSFIKPMQILTNQTINNLYVLDSGAGSIIQIQKDGLVKMQYRADILKNAKTFTINNDENAIFVLSNNKIWKLPL